MTYSELNYMHKQLLHLKKYKGKNDLDSAARKIMAEFGNPAQLKKKDFAHFEFQNDSSSRQKKFIKKFGQF